MNTIALTSLFSTSSELKRCRTMKCACLTSQTPFFTVCICMLIPPVIETGIYLVFYSSCWNIYLNLIRIIWTCQVGNFGLHVMVNVVEKSTIVHSVPEVSLFIPNLPDLISDKLSGFSWSHSFNQSFVIFLLIGKTLREDNLYYSVFSFLFFVFR